jgi:Na+-translocating ferredoxin:NAD+ oxidoreductase RnfD subunit
MSTDNRRTTAPPGGAGPKKGRFDKFKPYLAPFLITCILVLGNYQYGILESSQESALVNGTALAILTSIILELILARLATGRWPHLASAYITGISVGILVRSPYPLPYVLCSALSITSKYALRFRGRHLWNPSNLGVSLLLFLVPAAVAPLSQQWGNDIWVPLIIMALGSLILFTLGRLHITLTYVVAFAALSELRSILRETPWVAEVAQLTSPAYLLYMFFMITDPKTTTRTRGRQIAVAVLVAVVETVLRLYGSYHNIDVHAPYYALFIVAPVTNVVEILWDARRARKPAPAAVPVLAGGPPG